MVAIWSLDGESYRDTMITLKTIAALPLNATVWDQGKGAVTGFGARRQKGSAVSYIVKYRTADGRQR